MKVIPAINVNWDAEAEAVQQVEAVQSVATMLHIDVSDGSLTPVVTWNNPQRWQELSQGKPLQIHLMVADPETAIIPWLAIGIAQVIVHREVCGDTPHLLIERLSKLCTLHGTQLILAGGKDVPVEQLIECVADVTGFLLLTVQPGYSGQRMDSSVIEKIQTIRTQFPNIDIWVDGGINKETITAVREAGATGAVAASAVFHAEDPVAALTALQ